MTTHASGKHAQSPFKRDLARLQYDRTRELIFRNVSTFGLSPEHLGIAASSTMDCGLTILYAAARLSGSHESITPEDVLYAWTESMQSTFSSIHKSFESNFAEFIQNER